MARWRVEITVEPFVVGKPGDHVNGAIRALESAGLTPDVGPFGTTAEGESDDVLKGLAAATTAAFSLGATSVSVSVSLVVAPDDEVALFIESVRPVVARLGAVVIPIERMHDGDQPLLWRNHVVGGVRVAEESDRLLDAVPRLITKVADEFGAPLAALSREDKQRAAQRLEELGAFQLRNATDIVADALGVTRTTVYNYLSAMRRWSSPTPT